MISNRQIERWSIRLLVVVLAVSTVAGNYTIACGGGKALTDEVMGNPTGAKERAVQAVKEVNETERKWTDWAKEKIQEGLGLGLGFKNNQGCEGSQWNVANAATCAANKVKEKIEQFATVAGQYTAEKAKEAKDETQQMVTEASHKASEKAQQAEEKASETAQQAKEKASETANWAGNLAQEAADQKADGCKQRIQKAQDLGKKVADEAREQLNRAKEGYDSVKQKTTENLKAAKDKAQDITVGFHHEEL